MKAYICLFQPKSQWNRRPYLPNGLLSVAARLMRGGARVDLFDENVVSVLGDPRSKGIRDADFVGISVFGPPQIPEAIELASRIRAIGCACPIVFGGQGCMVLSAEEQTRIFGRISGEIRIVSKDSELGDAFGLDVADAYSTSMAPAIEALPEQFKRAYFTTDWCLYTSRGCEKACQFCIAEKRTAPSFRDEAAFGDEVECLARNVRRYAGPLPAYDVYLSTLDALQDPGRLERLLKIFSEAIGRHGLVLKFRCLATAQMTARAATADPELFARWREYGLSCVGLGVDGADETMWRREGKGHNSAEAIETAFDALRRADILAEAVMVMAFSDDDTRTLARCVASSWRFVRRGTLLHPYLAKTAMPGSRRWREDRALRERYLQDPGLFSDVDFGSLATPLTHPNARQRLLANIAYLAALYGAKAISPRHCQANPLVPTVGSGRIMAAVGRLANRLVPQER